MAPGAGAGDGSGGRGGGGGRGRGNGRGRGSGRGGGRGGAGRLDVRATRAQTRANARLVLGHVFPLVGWLKGQRPATDLEAKWELLGQFGVIVARMFVETRLLSLGRETIEAIYLRDNRLFFSLIVQTALVSFGRSCLFASTFWMRIRVGIVWREKLTRLIHEKYLSNMVYYKQLNLEDGVQDPEERLARDIERAADELGDLLYSVAYALMMGVYSSVRLAYFVSVYHVGFAVAYSWLSIRVREFIVSGAKMGQMRGRFNQSTGLLKSAHRELVLGAESIVAYSGLDREREMTMRVFDENMKVRLEDQWTSMKSSIGLSFQFRILMMTCTNLMIQLPFLRPNHPLKAKPGATQQERFEANAAMLGEMRFTMGLMMECIMHIGQLSRLDRELMMLSGQLNRTAALLTVCDRVGKAGTADAEAIRDDDGGITFDKVTVRSPTGRTLIEDLSFSLATGGNDNMLVVGEPGVGKTSILRTLRGLWPAGGGRILRPATGIIYCPQTPYLVPGCALQDQLT